MARRSLFLARWSRRRLPRHSVADADDLIRSLAVIVEPDALRDGIARGVRDLIGADTVVFCALRPEEEGFVGSLVTGAAPSSEVTLRFEATGTLCRWLKVNEDVFLVPHPTGALAHLDEAERRTVEQIGARVCAPVWAGRQLVGILVAIARNLQWRFRRDDRDVLLRVGRQAGLALQNAELQRLERERLRNVYRAEQLAVAGQLAATVAHEIRNPLTAIRSTVQYTLSSSAEWDTKERLLSGILEAVDRIERTIGGVLALTRLDQFDVKEVDLVAALEDAVSLTEAYARARGIAIERQFDVVSVQVAADRQALLQVCTNLMLNACQAMPDGGRVTLRCGVTDAPAQPGSALMQIRDTGHGIAPEDLARVFDPFFTTKPGGTGLGLAICMDIVTRHRGQLRLDSEPGRGTTATMLLPLCAD